jgi:SAM-dependent methyltransferase
MMGTVTDHAAAAAHWDGAYALGDTDRSWFQDQPSMSLQMLDAAALSPGNSVVDVGAGASRLADRLLDRGFTDVSVLDISAAGLQYAQRRLGPRARHVDWIVTDILSWRPPRRYQAWHDRAVFHFLTTSAGQQRYLQTLDAATAEHAAAIFGCFAPDGPPRCSGLPVARYDPEELAARLGPHWSLIARAREEHATPGGAVQPFTWTAFRRGR